MLSLCGYECFIPYAVWSKNKPLGVKDGQRGFITSLATKVITTKTKGHAAEVKAKNQGSQGSLPGHGRRWRFSLLRLGGLGATPTR